MAKRSKSGSKTPYRSKGQRPNVARKTVNALRQDRRKSPSVQSIFQKLEHRQMVLSRPKDRNLATLHKKYIEQERIRHRALDLFVQFKSAGVKWSACVQAVKTDWIVQFEMKFGKMNIKTKEKLKASGK